MARTNETPAERTCACGGTYVDNGKGWTYHVQTTRHEQHEARFEAAGQMPVNEPSVFKGYPDETLVACGCGGGFVDPVDRERNEAHVHTPAHVSWIVAAEAWKRQPVDTTGAALVPGTAYRLRYLDRAFFAIYRDAVVEDDDSITLVIEDAHGTRDGYSASKWDVEPINGEQAICQYPDEPTLQRAADGDR